MRAFVLTVSGWVIILLARVLGPDSVLAEGGIAFFFFLAAFICLILGIGRRQQRGWNIAALVLLLLPLLAVAALVEEGIILGS